MVKCKDCEHLRLDPKEDVYHTQRFCALADRKIATYGHLLPKTSPRWCPLVEAKKSAPVTERRGDA